MEKETPEAREPGGAQEGETPGGEGTGRSTELRPDWRLTPPSEKRVIRRGTEVELPHIAPPEIPKRSSSRKKPTPVRYGYRVEIPKELTKRPADSPGIARRIGSYFARLLGRRERADDRMDRTAWIMAGVAGILFFILSWLPWFRVSWTPGTGEGGGGSATLRFFDLGVVGYVVPVLAFLLAAAAILSYLHRFPRVPLDVGAIVGLLAVTSLALLLFVLIGNVGILSGAGRRSGQGSNFIEGMFITKNSQIAAYIGVLCIIAAVTSSLLRLAERKAAKGPVEE